MKLIVNGKISNVPSGSGSGSGNVSSLEIDTIKVISRAAYDALPNRPSTTVYLIQG